MKLWNSHLLHALQMVSFLYQDYQQKLGVKVCPAVFVAQAFFFCRSEAAFL